MNKFEEPYGIQRRLRNSINADVQKLNNAPLGPTQKKKLKKWIDEQKAELREVNAYIKNQQAGITPKLCDICGEKINRSYHEKNCQVCGERLCKECIVVGYDLLTRCGACHQKHMLMCQNECQGNRRKNNCIFCEYLSRKQGG